jgi:hypothetical protein
LKDSQRKGLGFRAERELFQMWIDNAHHCLLI